MGKRTPRPSGRKPYEERLHRLRLGPAILLRRLAPGRGFRTRPAESGSRASTHGVVVGPGTQGGVEVLVKKLSCAPLEWSGAVYVYPVED
jgi:hypothetical protein